MKQSELNEVKSRTISRSMFDSRTVYRLIIHIEILAAENEAMQKREDELRAKVKELESKL